MLRPALHSVLDGRLRPGAPCRLLLPALITPGSAPDCTTRTDTAGAGASGGSGGRQVRVKAVVIAEDYCQ